jgi:hypothetical protein
VYGSDADVECPRCERSRHPDFLLASKKQIFELLDWS